MQAVTLRSAVFVKEPVKWFGREAMVDTTVIPLMQSKTRSLMEKFTSAGNRASVLLRWNFMPWPEPRRKENIDISTSNLDTTLQYLDEPRFDADWSLCVLKSIEEVDVVVGHLLTRPRRHLHVCLCTLDTLPDFTKEKDRDLFRRIQTIPIDVPRNPRSGMSKPFAAGETPEWNAAKNPMAKGVLAIRQIDEFHISFIEDLLRSLRIQKIGV